MQHPACMRAVVPTLLIFSTLLGTLVHLLSPALAQQSVSDPVYRICNGATFTSSGSFAENLNTVATSLKQISSRALYSSVSSQTGFETDYVHGMYQCRGDLSLSACSACVISAFTTASGLSSISFCDFSSIGGRVQYQGCFLRYENYVFDTVLETKVAVQPSCSAGSASQLHLYRQNLGIALNNSATAAPEHPLFGFNATSAGSGSNTAYALTQCLGYLNSVQCATCLSHVSNYTTVCNTSSVVSGQVYFIACYYLFNNTPFVLTYSNVSLPGNVSPALSPMPVIASVSTERRRSNHRAADTVRMVVGISALILACIIAALALYFLKRQKKLDAETQGEQELLMFGARRFSLKELQDATDNFHPTKMLGAGGFGPVYQGRLESGKEVAIKMLSSQSHQGELEFVNEVSLITTVQHRNLVQLIGCCVEDSRHLLVYEYLPNRSLDLCLFGANENNALDWRTRFEIVVGIARGLRYLHEDSPVRIIHRDIKASNILLDNNFNPKIADFGLARLFPDDTSHLTTRVVGTLGYLAPEYAIRGQLTEKADVYGFGLLALEIVSGRKVVESAFETDKENLLDWTWASYEKQQHMQIVDGRMHANVGEVIRVMHVALLCTQLQPEARPSMSEVHDMLCGQSEILNLPTKPMTVGMLSSEGSSIASSSFNTRQRAVQLTYSYDASLISEVEPR